MSINLLPQKEKSRIQKIYKSRRLRAASWLVIVLVAVSIIMLVPIYLLAKNTQVLADQKKEQLNREDNYVDAHEVKDTIFLINKKARVLADAKHTRVYNLFSDITENKRASISITGLAFHIKETEDSTFEEISIVGNAKDRETLLAFRRDLEQKEYVQEVNLPVSNFAQNADIDFSIKITLRAQ